jgi:Flp pilus assembly protein TadG
MLETIRRQIRRLSGSNSGNATLLLATGLPALIGTAGAAIDFSQWYAWKQELQMATDQAALAAAWSLSQDADQDTYETRGRQNYRSNLALTADFATDAAFELADYANGNLNSIAVSASATRSLPFSSFIMSRAVTVSAYSQASFEAGTNYAACLIAVGDNGTTFEVGGNANVTARCGLAALSCSDDAIVIDGSATVVTDSIATCGTASVPSTNESVLTEKMQGLEDTFADLSPPTNTTARTYKCNGNGSKSVATPLAGTYSDFVVSCKTTMSKGIYVIDGGTLDLTGNFSVTGTNVMFVLKNGATLKLGGSGDGNVLTLTPMQASDFSALGYSSTLANRYANMLIFEDRASEPTEDHIINGNSNSLFEGTIYLPKGTARINGTASIDSSCLQISAFKINVLGNAALDTRCPTSATNSAGTSAASVKLVV